MQKIMHKQAKVSNRHLLFQTSGYPFESGESIFDRMLAKQLHDMEETCFDIEVTRFLDMLDVDDMLGIKDKPKDAELDQQCGKPTSVQKIESLRKKIDTQESQLRLYQDTKNNELNCSVLAGFLMRYLQSKEKKSLARREAAKDSVIDIISELRTQPYLPNGLLDYISDFDDETVPQYHANTIVMNQHNDHYVGIVEQGGTGVNINQNDLSLWKQKRK